MLDVCYLYAMPRYNDNFQVARKSRSRWREIKGAISHGATHGYSRLFIKSHARSIAACGDSARRGSDQRT